MADILSLLSGPAEARHWQRSGMASCCRLACAALAQGRSSVILVRDREEYTAARALLTLFSPSLSLADMAPDVPAWKLPFAALPAGLLLRRDRDSWAGRLAALYGLPLKPIAPYRSDVGQGSLTVTVEDTERCPRYVAASIENLYVKPSTYQMQSRIWKVGMRPINALVDVTNYVMLATGQPTHAFDSDHIAGHIIVRRAAEGEKLLLLNGKELPLSTDDLVIADDAGAVGLAGVMGGAKDSILPETSRVILEVANFDAKGIRRTALRYDNRTEASARYEKAIDPERCDQALAMSMELFGQLYPEMKVTGLSDLYPQHLKQAEIDVTLSWLERRLGKSLTPDDVKKKMELLGYQVTFDGDNMHVVVPTWRSTGDVSIKADIMEEVARMYGYENFEAAPITTSFDGAINQLDKDLERKIKEYLSFRCGMQEIFTYPWMDELYVNAVLQSTDGILALSTPPCCPTCARPW